MSANLKGAVDSHAARARDLHQAETESDFELPSSLEDAPAPSAAVLPQFGRSSRAVFSNHFGGVGSVGSGPPPTSEAGRHALTRSNAFLLGEPEETNAVAAGTTAGAMSDEVMIEVEYGDPLLGFGAADDNAETESDHAHDGHSLHSYPDDGSSDSNPWQNGSPPPVWDPRPHGPRPRVWETGQFLPAPLLMHSVGGFPLQTPQPNANMPAGIIRTEFHYSMRVEIIYDPLRGGAPLCRILSSHWARVDA